jgi:4-phosphopantoate--beta-alanine ligase
MIRENLVKGFKNGIVVPQGLIAHGRGEAFDYLIGERTQSFAEKAIKVGVAYMLTAKNSVISVNGNVAALCPKEVVKLSKLTSSKVEVNLFHRTREREERIAKVLKEKGLDIVLGIRERESIRIPEMQSERRKVDLEGIWKADVVLIPLEDGDRAEALAKLGKLTIAIDLNPLSRTVQSATVAIIDNVVRALPKMVKEAERLRKLSKNELEIIKESYSKDDNIREALRLICNRLASLCGEEFGKV